MSTTLNFTEVSSTGEQWELFARDFLLELGFTIETSPDRGADGGKDMIISENLTGRLSNFQRRWIVSCKHFALSGRSVNETDEQNILERIKSYKTCGFIGFYSTLASAALNERLRKLKENGDIEDFKIFDHRLIEKYITSAGYSRLMARYMPENYKNIRPIHYITSEYIPLLCEISGIDILSELYARKRLGNIIMNCKKGKNGSYSHVISVHWVLKEHDSTLQKKIRAPGTIDKWEDISDLVSPIGFLRWLFAIMNNIRDESITFEDDAYKKLRTFIMALAQVTIRESTERERERIAELASIPCL